MYLIALPVYENWWLIQFSGHLPLLRLLHHPLFTFNNYSGSAIGASGGCWCASSGRAVVEQSLGRDDVVAGCESFGVHLEDLRLQLQTPMTVHRHRPQTLPRSIHWIHPVSLQILRLRVRVLKVPLILTGEHGDIGLRLRHLLPQPGRGQGQLWQAQGVVDVFGGELRGVGLRVMDRIRTPLTTGIAPQLVETLVPFLLAILGQQGHREVVLVELNS